MLPAPMTTPPSAARPTPRSRLVRFLGWTAAAFALAVTLVVIDGWTAFGHRAEGARLARMQRSPQWRDGSFANPQPIVNDNWGALASMFRASPHVRPEGPLPVGVIDPKRFETPPQTGLRVTWFGHSAILVEIDGYRILTDPHWSDRSSYFTWAGPTRWFARPLELDALPPIDAVVVSHDHPDHLDYGTIVALKDRVATFVVPLGVGAHLEYWGIAPEKIVELDWWETARVRGLEIVSTPARHASGRLLFDKDATLWSGFALAGPEHRVFYSGDTGLFPAMKEIGERLGPFDVTLFDAGQYHQAWPDWHIGPEQAVLAHTLVRGRVFMPVHWALFTLASHGWTEPAERTLSAARRLGVTVVVPRPADSVEPLADAPVPRWWPEVPWVAADRDPIVSSQN